MLCGNCGKRVPDDAVFCSYCGAALHPKKASAEKAESTGGETLNLPKREKTSKPAFADQDRVGNTFQFDKKSGSKLSYVQNSNFRAPTPSKDITTNLGPLKKKGQIKESKPVVVVISLFAVFLLIISIIWTVQRNPSSSGSKTTADTGTVVNAVEPVTESSSVFISSSSPAGEVIETTTQLANSGSFTTRPGSYYSTSYTLPRPTTTNTTMPASTTTTKETTGYWNMTTTSAQMTDKY